jgi:Trk K+ transport system NAD-binding subunit
LRALRWPLAIVLFLAATVLGFYGFDGNMAALNQPGTFADKLYLSLQLFVLQSGAVPPPVPWQLEVARFLAPAVAAYATLSAAAALLGEQLSGMRARIYSDHVVVCGLGRLGALMARSLRSAGYDVVAIESDPLSPGIGECREEGVIVRIGDAADRTVLRKVRVHRARYLFAVTGDDGVNAEIAIDAGKLVTGRHGPPLTCFVHILDDELAGVLRQAGVAGNGDSIRLEYFNAAERGAPALLRERPAFDDDGTTPLGPPHILVIGLGQMGRSLVLHAARRWRSIPAMRGKRFKVTVVDRRADAHVAALNERLPRLSTVCDMVDRRMELDSAEFERADFLFGRKGVCDVTSVYVCLGDDAAGLSAALRLRHRLGDRKVPIVVRTTQDGGVAALLKRRGIGDEADTRLETFGLLDLVCKPDVLLGGQNEVLARAIHEAYVRRERDQGKTQHENPSMVEWDLLPESLRESNRDQAADISRKLGAIGYGISPLIDWDATLPEFSPPEIELLARMEHDRWWRERKAAGWRPGPRKDDARKESPYLVPYDELPDEIQEYDRAAVRGMPAFLAEVDFAVVRVGPAS